MHKKLPPEWIEHSTFGLQDQRSTAELRRLYHIAR